MKVVRRGHKADHGENSVELAHPEVGWDRKEECVVLKESAVADFSLFSSARHDYAVSVSLNELGTILDVLAGTPAEQLSEVLAGALTPHLRALLRPAAVCVQSGGTASARQGQA